MRSDSKSKAKEGFAPLKQDEDSIFNDEPAGAVGGGNSAKKKELTKKQRKWWRILGVALVLDLLIPLMAYLTTHEMDFAEMDFAPGRAFDTMTTDTLDVCFMGAGRFVVNVLLLRLILSAGLVKEGNEDVLPHKMSDAARAQERHSEKIRIVLLICAFFTGTTCSLYTGVKCIIFDFDAVPGPEGAIAPFLGMSIGTMNFQFVAIKKLVEAYVAEVGVVLSPLHVHQLKYYKKGPPGQRRRKQCDICREGVHIKPCYNCKDCTFNLCITCFETKSGELLGDEVEKVVRGDKGKKDKTVLDTCS